MLRAILNRSRRQHPKRHQLYGHLPPITKTIQFRRTRHAGHGWRSRDDLISDLLLWTPTYGRAKAGRPAWTYIQQLCEDTGCSPENTLKMQIWIATNTRDVARVMKTKFLATVMVFGVVSSEGHIMPTDIFGVGLKVNTKVYLDVPKSVVIPWYNQVAGGRPCVWQQDSAPAHMSKETQAWFQKECYDFEPLFTSPPLLPRPEPAQLLRLVIRREHHQHDLPTTPKPAWSPPPAEYSPSSHRRLWKRHAPCSRTVPRR